jgi:hypothetical protein
LSLISSYVTSVIVDLITFLSLLCDMTVVGFS